ncbi:hypothetical protein [Peribacillus asahii]|uniref:hypothetical protein n=1 Tax=Peribacillus asahii TaxID=228899 RepID=UPI00207927FD|nr:hypothetical protein [Peribacillus asahii]USK69898.1 hypothetical protein LIS76_20650 [Peribacillus asahii]
MSNTHKDFLKGLNLGDLRKGLNLGDLRKRLKSDIGEIEETLNDSKKLLESAERLLRELNQNGITNQDMFFNVAPPAAPPDAPPAVTPTPIVQVITKDIARIAREIRIKQSEFDQQIFLTIVSLIVLRDLELDPEERTDAFLDFFTAVGRIEIIRRELQSLRDELEADVAILSGIAGGLLGF